VAIPSPCDRSGTSTPRRDSRGDRRPSRFGFSRRCPEPLGLSLSKTRGALEALRGRGDAEYQPEEERVVSFTPEGDKVIDLAPAEAKLLNAEKVSDTHVLLAVLRNPGKAEAMLQSLGLSIEAVRQKVIGGQ
jgi:ATP-dependent Clp protease ATP-binding subunit ClpA